MSDERRGLTADILVAGAGPAGLALALQAHDHGAAVRVIDRRPEAAHPSRALILHARTLEVLRPLGVTQALLARADTAPAADLRLGSRTVRVTLGGLALRTQAQAGRISANGVDHRAAARPGQSLDQPVGSPSVTTASTPAAPGWQAGDQPQTAASSQRTSLPTPIATSHQSQLYARRRLGAFRIRRGEFLGPPPGPAGRR